MVRVSHSAPANVVHSEPSNLEAQPVPPTRGRVLGASWEWWAGAALLALLLIGLYFHVVIKLVGDWIRIQDDSHGLLIPFFVLFLLWRKRDEFRATPRQPSWAGVPLVVVALFVLLIGIFGADLFLSRVSFLLLVAGLIWTLLGRFLLFKSWFLLFVMALGIPLPTLILNHITFPLQLFTSVIASNLLPVAGVPVLRDGNIITLPAMPLEVAEACSGIRSLSSLFTVAVLYGYLMEKRWDIRVLLALASVPIAVMANVGRIFGTGLCVQYWDPEKALGFFHEFSGLVMFLISLSCLYLFHRLVLLTMSKRETAS